MKIIISADVDTTDYTSRVSNVWGAIEQHEGRSYYGDSLCKDFGEGVGPGSTIYVVVADYFSGAGSRGGAGHGSARVVDAFADLETATALAHAAFEVKEGEKYFFTFQETEYDRDWTDYFATLNEIGVWTITVREFRPPFGRKAAGVVFHLGT